MITDPGSAVAPLALDGLTVIGRGLGRSATSECASFFTPVVQTGQNSLDSHPVKVRSAGNGQLLDVVPGRKAESPTAWLKARGEAWLSQVSAGALDLSGPYRKVFEDTVPHATLVADH